MFGLKRVFSQAHFVQICVFIAKVGKYKGTDLKLILKHFTAYLIRVKK